MKAAHLQICTVSYPRCLLNLQPTEVYNRNRSTQPLAVCMCSSVSTSNCYGIYRLTAIETAQLNTARHESDVNWTRTLQQQMQTVHLTVEVPLLSARLPAVCNCLLTERSQRMC